MKYKIHRLCRDNNTVRRLKKEEKKFNLPQSEYTTGIDLFTFINNIINNCPDDYALIVHDDVILPMNISDNIQRCIKSANNFLGEENWGVIGNAGVEVLTKKVLLYLSDPNIRMIVPSTKHPELVESVDGNVMLLNLKNIRRRNILLPKNLKGFHLYDLILSLEIQKNNLVCAVSSLLYSRHLSGGSRENFKKALDDETFQDYFAQNYSNRIITSINGDITVKQQMGDNRNKRVEDLVKNNLTEVFKDKSFKLFLLIELDRQDTKIFKLLESIKLFKDKLRDKIDVRIVFITSRNTEQEKHRIENITLRYQSLEISTIYIKDRQNYFQQLCDNITLDKSTYLSIISADYIVLSDWSSTLPYLFSTSELIISPKGNSEEDTSNSLIQNLLSGNPEKQSPQVSSMIFNSTLLERLVEKDLLVPRSLENYIVFLASVKDKNPKIVKSPFYKISGNDPSKKLYLNYEYTTVMARLVNEDLIPQSFFKFLSAREEHWYKIVDQLYNEINNFKQNFVWKILKKLGRFKRILRKNST